MFKVNVSTVEKMTEREMFEAESMYLILAAYCHNQEFASGSRAMAASPEKIAIPSYSFSERQLLSSYKELFHLSTMLYKRTGEHLIGFVSREERTPDNALKAWWKLYKAIEKGKEAQKARSTVA